MTGIMYDLPVPKALLKLLHLSEPYSMIGYRTNWPDPKIEPDSQGMVKPRLRGICGTDEHRLH